MTSTKGLFALVLAIGFSILLAVGCTTAAQLPVTPAPTSASTAMAPGSGSQSTVLAPTTTAQPALPAIPTLTAGPGPSALPTSTTVPTGQPSTTVVASPSATPSVGSKVGPTPTVQPFSGHGAYEHLKILASQIGSRPAGSSALEEAATYVKGQFDALGYQTSVQSFATTGFQERASSLVVNQPQQVEVDAKAMALSAAGDVEGQLVYAGIGRPSDFPAAGVRGKIVLIDRGGEITFQSKVDAATSRGASAVVIANDRPGELRGSLAQAAKVPVVAILQADGEKLREFIRQTQTTVTLRVDASTTTRQGKNVVATSGGASGRKKVILGAHYDSVAAGPGANDNGSGTATLLQLAREVRERSYPFDLVFIAFGDEEIGLVGSRAFVQGLSQQERGQIVAMLNLDMVGVGDKMAFGGDRDLVSRTLQIAQRAGYSAQQLTLGPNMSSDHASFLEAGIPAVFFHRLDDPNYHTARDTLEAVLPSNLEATGTVAIGLLDSLARGNR